MPEDKSYKSDGKGGRRLGIRSQRVGFIMPTVCGAAIYTAVPWCEALSLRVYCLCWIKILHF